MNKYFSLPLYKFLPRFKRVREINYNDVKDAVKYLQELCIGEKLRFDRLLPNVVSKIIVAKISNLVIYKIAIYKKWDLNKEFLPIDIAWVAIDEFNVLKFISFDKEFFFYIIKSKTHFSH